MFIMFGSIYHSNIVRVPGVPVITIMQALANIFPALTVQRRKSAVHHHGHLPYHFVIVLQLRINQRLLI